MSIRRIATYILAACFYLLATSFLLTFDLRLLVASLVAQVAMFIPEWGGRK